MAKTNKKVCFSDRKEEFEPGFNSTSEVVSLSSDESIKSEKSSSSGSNLDADWDSGFSSKPHRTVTDAPKPEIFTATASVVLIPIHYLAVIYLSFVQFDIAKDPRIGIIKTFYALAITQLFYGIILTRNANRSRRSLRKKKSTKHSKETKPIPHTQKVQSTFNSGDLMQLIVSFILSLIGSIPIYLILILFGAPIGSYTMKTFMLAMNLSLLAVFPLLCNYRPADHDFNQCWSNLLTFQVAKFYKNQIYMTAIGALIGCWLGVITIPLDWDRPWQAWPITLLAGGYMGGFVGNLVGYILAKVW